MKTLQLERSRLKMFRKNLHMYKAPRNVHETDFFAKHLKAKTKKLEGSIENLTTGKILAQNVQKKFQYVQSTSKGTGSQFFVQTQKFWRGIGLRTRRSRRRAYRAGRARSEPSRSRRSVPCLSVALFAFLTFITMRALSFGYSSRNSSQKPPPTA